MENKNRRVLTAEDGAAFSDFLARQKMKGCRHSKGMGHCGELPVAVWLVFPKNTSHSMMLPMCTVHDQVLAVSR